MLCNKISFKELLECFGNYLENNFENDAWSMEYGVWSIMQEIQNLIIQGIMSIITSTLS